MSLKEYSIKDQPISLTPGEFKEAKDILKNTLYGQPGFAQRQWERWFKEAPSNTSRERRKQVGRALNLNVDL